MIENKFLQGILAEFKNDFSLQQENESKSFEHLINYLVVTKLIPDAISSITDLQDINVDAGSNFGIDGIAILVNNNLLTNGDF